MGDGVKGVNVLEDLLVLEVALEQSTKLGDLGAAADQHNLVDLLLGHLGISQDAVEGVEGVTEEVGAERLELSAGDGEEEVDSLRQVVNLYRRLMHPRQADLRLLALVA
mmetsp:Transcript_22501/g.73832  ORF Transcript_22501/g.73832 Transcript_22501/m.73832 type:complete len:109 (-) Transcript_22501:1116-1442(-)